MARELNILPRFKRGDRVARKHPKFDRGFAQRHLGADLVLTYRVRRNGVVLHRLGTHQLSRWFRRSCGCFAD